MDKTIKIDKGLVIIRDTETNEVMCGRKGQYMFDNAGTAKLSAGHTDWFDQYKRTTALTQAGLGDTAETYMLLEKQCQEFEKATGQSRLMLPTKLANKWSYARTAFLSASYSEKVENLISKIKFAKQPRYVVESVLEIKTKQISGRK